MMKKTILTLAVYSIFLSACSKVEVESPNNKNENSVVLGGERVVILQVKLWLVKQQAQSLLIVLSLIR